MFKKIPFWIFALLIWLVGCSFYCYTFCCGAGLLTTSGLLIKDGATTVASNSANNLLFAFSGAKANTSLVKKEFGDLAAYLKKNPDKTMTMTGLYKSDEKNSTSFANLGLGRAEDMKKYMLGLGVPAYQILTTSKKNDGLDFNADKFTAGGINYAFTTFKPANISINDGAKSFKAGTADNLRFTYDGAKFKTPLDAKLDGVFAQTAAHLKKNPERTLTITGLYEKGEKKPALLANMGESRANAIKSYLQTTHKVSGGQIALNSRMIDKGQFRNKELIGGASYAFAGKANDNRLAQIEKRLKGKPIILYFATNSSNLTLTDQQRKDFADIIYYLDRKEGSSLTSIGHTDSRGDRSINVRLGRKRAEFVQDYISKNGKIKSSLIKTSSKGPDSPIDSNDTDSGRQKNRRVEVTLR